MIQETIATERKLKNRSYITDKKIGKQTANDIDYEKLTIPGQPMTQEEFVQMIEEAENSPTMTLDEFNIRWNIEIQRIKKLIV